nr:transposase [Geminisphaera colitermitum]
MAADVQEVTGQKVEVSYVDQGYTGENAEQSAQAHNIKLHVVKPPQTKRGVVLLPRRWVLERSFGLAARFRSLARDYK